MKLALPDTLTKEEYENIIKDWNEENKKKLIEGNMRLAIKIANSFYNTKIDQEDLWSIAFLGLIKAANTFDPHREIKFTTYMTTVIKNEIKLEIRSEKMNVAAEDSLDDVKAISYVDGCEILLSDTIVGSEFDEEYKQYEMINEVMRGLQKMDERDKRIMSLRMKGYKQETIAQVMNMSQSMVSRIIKLFKKDVMIKAG